MTQLEINDLKTKNDVNEVWFNAIYDLANEIINECGKGKMNVDLLSVIEKAKEIKVFAY